ncbi:hypothetical protein HYALB_00008853 [Hymenoscyphus albidus]|uniref:MYND-type domain-containing protein n=1 Tax=Hymenoscyphus albidus TaxID=595503 RepID=A0A9N9LQV7_9HELO|nr:hypothetical protein HYALB_00008853 [Hymenoscyphus albidus]
MASPNPNSSRAIPTHGFTKLGAGTPILAIRGVLCMSCWKEFYPGSLKKCTGCKRASYCSTECQKNDWGDGHKRFCKFSRGFNSSATEISMPGRTWEEYSAEKWEEVKEYRINDQPFDGTYCDDWRLIMYETVCQYCYRSALHLKKDESLKLCPTCSVASFCTSCPQIHSESQCGLFAELAFDERFVVDYLQHEGENFVINRTQIPRTEHIPLSTASGWYDYYTRISDKAYALTPYTDLVPQLDHNPISALGLMRKLTTSLALPLTILAGLEAVLPDLTTRKSISLHLIGASGQETQLFPVFSEILHQLPSLLSLKIFAVGFDLPQHLVEKYKAQGEAVEVACCDICVDKGCSPSLALWKAAYHDFAASNQYEKPDLAVAFQSGFSQEDRVEWMPTIKHLAQASHPTLFTCYTELEMLEETTIFKTIGANFLKQPEINKWRSLVPVLDPPAKNEEDDGELKRLYGGENVQLTNGQEGSVYFQQYYWYVIGPKVS